MKKRILLIFTSLALILSFSACDTPAEVTSPTPVSTPDSAVIDDGLPDLNAEVLIRVVNPNIENADSEYPYFESWSDVIQDRFGIDIKVNFFPLYKVLKERPEQVFIYDFLKMEPQDGLLLHDLTDTDISYNVMKSLIEEGGILPVTEYVNNSVYKDNFDSGLINMLTDDNGDIWGIPADSAHSMFDVRAYKKSWLDTVNLGAPATVDEFYEVMKAFTYNDPDEDGLNNTFGYYGPYNFKFSLNDVLKAYGLYNGSSSFIAYNPNTGTIEDSLLSPDALTALNFIRDIYKNKLVKETGITPGIYDSIIPKDCGSLLYQHSAEDDTVYSATPLVGTNTDNLVQVTTYGKVYFLLSGNEDPQKSFDSFVSLVYGNEEAYLMMKYGIPGRHYDVDSLNEAIILKDPNLTNENIGKVNIGTGMSVEGDLLPYLLGRLGEYNADSYSIFYNEIIKEANYRDIAAYKIEQAQSYQQSIAAYSYNIPSKEALVQSDFVDNWTLKIGEEYLHYRDLEQSVVGERIISVSDALDEYIQNMKIIGLQDLIDEANVNLGKNTVYSYD